MVSDFRRKKLLHVFTSFFDRNGSGSIDKKDFELAVENIAKLRRWSVGSPKYKEIETSLLKIWESLQSHADSDKDGQISVDEWISMWEEYAKNPSAPLEWQDLYCKFIFDLEDVSGDGAIDSDKFSSVYSSFGMNKDEAMAAFSKMAKGKTSVSWSEFQTLWKEYFVTEDQSAAGNYIFGKSSF